MVHHRPRVSRNNAPRGRYEYDILVHDKFLSSLSLVPNRKLSHGSKTQKCVGTQQTTRVLTSENRIHITPQKTVFPSGINTICCITSLLVTIRDVGVVGEPAGGEKVQRIRFRLKKRGIYRDLKRISLVQVCFC